MSVIGADFAWKRGQLGVGIGIAVIDSGIDAGEDLKGGGLDQKNTRVVYSESFIDGEKETKDAYGHGTHVAGSNRWEWRGQPR